MGIALSDAPLPGEDPIAAAKCLHRFDAASACRDAREGGDYDACGHDSEKQLAMHGFSLLFGVSKTDALRRNPIPHCESSRGLYEVVIEQECKVGCVEHYIIIVSVCNAVVNSGPSKGGNAMFRVKLLALFAFVFVGGLLVAAAAPSCGQWMIQTDNTWWRMCAEDDGKYHCYSSPAGTDPIHNPDPNRIKEIKCK